jgi:magnesium-transporting ATPase (P-type)
MITGDHKETAIAIARELGLHRDGGVALSGSELDSLTDEQLNAMCRAYERVRPCVCRAQTPDCLRMEAKWSHCRYDR